jgi:hypothetical protein
LSVMAGIGRSVSGKLIHLPALSFDAAIAGLGRRTDADRDCRPAAARVESYGLTVPVSPATRPSGSCRDRELNAHRTSAIWESRGEDGVSRGG